MVILRRYPADKPHGVLSVAIMVFWVVFGAFASSTPRLSPEIRSELDELSRLLDGPRYSGGLKKQSPGNGNVANVHAEIWQTDSTPLDVVLRRTEALNSLLRSRHGSAEYARYAEKIQSLRGRTRTLGKARGGALSDEGLTQEVFALRKKVALSNPLVDFDEVVFVRYSYRSEDDYKGGHIQSGQGYTHDTVGGIYILSGIQSGNHSIQNLLQDSRFQNGPHQGMRILDLGGAYGMIDLDYDAQRLVFAWTPRKTTLHTQSKDFTDWRDYAARVYTDSSTFHIYTVNIDGSNLRQITLGSDENLDPCWLPNGRIAFCSSRHGTVPKCHNMKGPYAQYVLHSMKDDGSDIISLSWNGENEHNPSVNQEGKIVYTRWDYVDRHFNAGQHFWICGPDGTDPRAPHGNYQKKLGGDGGPFAEWWIRSIPQTATKYVAIAGNHHAPNVECGVPFILDVSRPDDRALGQITRVIPKDACNFESDYDKGARAKYNFQSPWPLDEEFMLICLSQVQQVQPNPNTDGLYLLDVLGNRVLIDRCAVDRGGMQLQAIPLKPRPRPPQIPVRTFQGERAGHPDHKPATISVVNVYDSDQSWPEGTKIEKLRIVQVCAREWKASDYRTPMVNTAKGYGGPGGTQVRAILGTVPVESDGSAYFEAPVGKGIYFEALDSRNLAVMSMLSLTYVHPGENLSCAGCHEDKWSATPTPNSPIAFGRAPSKIEPEIPGTCPPTAGRLVKPVFDRVCLPCHAERADHGEPAGPTGSKMSAYNLSVKYGGANKHSTADPSGGTTRSKPGRVGARNTKLGQILLSENHQSRLSDEDLRRVLLWLDMKEQLLGCYANGEDTVSRQRTDDEMFYWPEDIEPWNPTAVEILTDDPTPPSVVPYFSVSDMDTIPVNQPPTAMKLEWGAAEDEESGVGCYNIYRNDEFLLATQHTRFIDRGVAPETEYVYRVSAVNRLGMEGPSMTQDGQTGSGRAIPQNAAGRSAVRHAVFRKLSSGGTTVELHLPSDAKEIMVTVYGLNGRTVQTVEATNLQAGKHILPLTPDRELSSGLYLGRIRIDNWHKTTSVSVW